MMNAQDIKQIKSIIKHYDNRIARDRKVIDDYSKDEYLIGFTECFALNIKIALAKGIDIIALLPPQANKLNNGVHSTAIHSRFGAFETNCKNELVDLRNLPNRLDPIIIIPYLKKDGTLSKNKCSALTGENAELLNSIIRTKLGLR